MRFGTNLCSVSSVHPLCKISPCPPLIGVIIEAYSATFYVV